MRDDLVTTLLPILARRSEPDFNVFDVMHHGSHEKQLSNVFAWLLDAEGTHRLGEAFQRIFIDDVNRGLRESEPIPRGAYSVRQEVNTSGSDNDMDIADLVLEGETTVLVVENYYTSDGHGHNFDGYQKFGARDGKRCAVVMLCRDVSPAGLTQGWENAAVVTYSSLITQLLRHVEGAELYRQTCPQQCAFFSHMHSHFVKGLRMNDHDLIRFIEAMCNTGQAEHFRQGAESAAVNFADILRARALEQFGESRELLRRVKGTLRTYCAGVLKTQVNESLGAERITDVSANYQGIYQWTINFALAGESPDSEAVMQVKFGPSAWFANEQDDHWMRTVPAAEADYSRLFLTRKPTKEIRQSSVTLQDVLDGIAPGDLRLRDEIVSLIGESA